MLQPLRAGIRVLRRSPGHIAVAVLALSLGIGLTTAVFSIAYGVFLRGLPFEGGDRLMRLEAVSPAAGGGGLPVSYLDFLDWRSQQKTFEALAAWAGSSLSVSGNGERPEQYNSAFVTAGFFDLVGVRPALGRVFRPEETGVAAAPVAVIGDALWRQRFAADPKILGRTLRIEGEETAIVGVMPPGFGFPLRQELWVPLRIDPGTMTRGADMPVQVLGKLAEGASREQALADLGTIAQRLAREYPETNEGLGVRVTPYVLGYTEELRPALYILLAAVFGVLLIACTNVATLLLVHTARRSQEVAVRTALGASRSRITAQFLGEACLLAVCGAVLGMAVARAGIGLYLHFLGGSLPSFWMQVGFDSKIFLFVAGLTLLASLISGALPAFQASRAGVSDVLKDQSRGVSGLRLGRLSRLLVIAEITLSCGLLVVTGLLIKSAARLQNVDLGFSTENVFLARLSLPYSRYPDPESRLRFADELLRRLEALPGTASAALVSRLPGDVSLPIGFELEGAAGGMPQEQVQALPLTVTPGFFQTLRIPVLRGRTFGAADTAASEPVAVVTRSFADRHFAGGNPLGRRIRAPQALKGAWLTIAGVVPDLLLGEIAKGSDQPVVFVAASQNPQSWMSILLRSQGAPGDLAERVAGEVAAIDPDLPVFGTSTLAEKMAAQTLPYRMRRALFSLLGAVALFLATLGLYGVMAFTVAQRTSEIGVRMALGAKRDDIVRLVFRSGFVQICAGLILGMALAAVLVRLLGTFLFSVEPLDPVVFTTVALTVVITGMLACALPVQRAVRIDPISALRSE